jgi:hypothetical protein
MTAAAQPVTLLDGGYARTPRWLRHPGDVVEVGSKAAASCATPSEQTTPGRIRREPAERSCADRLDRRPRCESWDEPVDRSGYDSEYLAEVERAERTGGTDEAVLTGRTRLRGMLPPPVVSEFGFLGGSIGTATAARIVGAGSRGRASTVPQAPVKSGGQRSTGVGSGEA